MIYIAHRGNIEGKNERLENDPRYIESALDRGFHAEVDVWYKDGWYLGHDKAQYQVTFRWLRNKSYACWYHAKNFEALTRLLKDGRIREVFWHHDDKYTLTKGGFIWTFPGNDFSKQSIVNLGIHDLTVFYCHGICADDVAKRK